MGSKSKNAASQPAVTQLSSSGTPPASQQDSAASSRSNDIPTTPPTAQPNKKLQALLDWVAAAGHNLADWNDLKDLRWAVVQQGAGVVLADGNQEAHLTLIAKISDDLFNLTPDGGWTTKTKFPHEFETQKASGYLIRPLPSGPLAANFMAALQHIHQLEAMGMPKETALQSCIREITGIKITWPLFERKASKADTFLQDDDAVSDDTLEPDNPFPIDEWPVSEMAQPELDKIKATHTTIPLPAYDKDGQLIPPTQYKSRLKGAIVKVKLAMKKFHYKDEGKVTYVAEIRDIILVQEPTHQSTSPLKHRALTDGPSESPTKKRRTAA